MKIQPNGNTPPIIMPGIGWVYTDCSGMRRGIWFVLTGCSNAYIEMQLNSRNIGFFYYLVNLPFFWNRNKLQQM